MSAVPDFLPALPELVLLAATLLLLMLGAFGGPETKRSMSWLTVLAMGVALVPTILGGPGAVNAGLIANQAIVALDFPLAMAISTIMIVTLVLLLYVGHRLFDLTKVLEPIS